MSIPADLIDRARRADILETAQSLGAGLRRVNATESVGPCLVCGGNDRFSTNSRRQLWNCRGGSTIDLVQHVRGCGFREAVAFLAGGDATQALSATQDNAQGRRAGRQGNQRRRHAAGRRNRPRNGPRSQHAGRAVLTRGPQDRHELNSRRDRANRRDRLASGRPIPHQDHALDGRRLGCIVGVMSDPSRRGRPAQSRERISTGLKVGKAKTLGAPAASSGSDDEDVLAGLSSGRRASKPRSSDGADFRPMWATGSTAIMAKFPVVAGIERLNYSRDRDQNGAGEAAARGRVALARGGAETSVCCG